MEAAAAGVVASAGGRAAAPPPPAPPASLQPPARKQWRAVSGSGPEELDRSKVGQSEERTIYEVQQGEGRVEVEFCAMDGGTDGDLLQQRFRDVSRRRDELQHLEIELRAQIIARTEILEMQRSFGAQMSEHVNASVKLKEQLQEREQHILELERKLEEKERELHTIKLDNQAAWAKEDLLREQDRELASYRRERDNSEAERAQHLKQIHELNELIHEKETRFIEQEEQHRVAQETILYKDERVREAQAWIARLQERDALQSTTNHSLQAELRERTEQLNQLWLGWQRQVIEMDRLHVQTVQQLQLELTKVREQNGLHADDSRARQLDSVDVSSQAEIDGDQFNGNDNVPHNASSAIQPNGNIENSQGLVSAGSATSQIEYVPGVPILSSSVLGVGGLHPSGQMSGLHSYVMPQSSTNTHIPLPHTGHYPAAPAVLSQQSWTNQQVVGDVSQTSHQNEYQHPEIDENNGNTDAPNYELSAIKESGRPGYLETQMNAHEQSGSQVVASSEAQVFELSGKQFLYQDSQQNLENGVSLLQDTLISGLDESKPLRKVMSIPQEAERGVAMTNPPQVEQDFVPVLPSPDISNKMSATNRQGSFPDAAKYDMHDAVASEDPATGQVMNPGNGRAHAPVLLDERSLLACIVRAIPAGSGGQIRISSTLPNRLSKMLAPLHWHDYRKQYGKLDEFVAYHPELFVIEGDFIHLRDGAQKIVSATNAAAKVAAAAAVSSPYSSMVPSVAVTPVAPPHRRVPSTSNQSDVSEKQLLDQHSNGLSPSGLQGSIVKILTKPKDIQGQNGLPSEIRSNHSSIHVAAINNSNSRRAGTISLQNRLPGNGNQGSGYGGKLQGRANNAGLTARR